MTAPEPLPHRALQADWVQWARIVVRAMQDSADPVGQVKLIFEGAINQLSALAGVLTQSSVDANNHVTFIRMIDLGEWSSAARTARDRYAKDSSNYPDPFLAAYLQHPKFGGPMSARRQDLVSDVDWYESSHYREFRVAAGQDACLYATIPVIFVPTGEKVLWTLCLLRGTGDAQFSESERDQAFGFLLSVEPILAEIWRQPESDLEIQIQSLPQRLRRVLGGLQSGLSEKEIARSLSLSQHTVHGYVKELYSKFGVRSRAELLIATHESTAATS